MTQSAPDAASGTIARYRAQLAGITELTVASMHLFTLLCERQKAFGVVGDIMEIGVCRAGTAALLGTALGATERLFLIDPYQDEAANRRTIEQFARVKPEQLLFHNVDSLALNKWREQVLSPQAPMVRFAHVDGQHSYDAVYSDLDLAWRYVVGGGLIVLDDIFNMNSACCTHAMFDYLRDHPQLQCVAMGFHKAYLCASRKLGIYRQFFVQVPELLAKAANLHVRLSFNSWAHERSYLTFDECGAGEPRYQVIGARFQGLEEALGALTLA